MPAGILAWWLVIGSLAGCGTRGLAVGTIPFPGNAPVFLDASGSRRASLPETPEPIRLLFLDFPWCPPCDGMWEGIGRAAKEFPPGTLRVYRILFDRERLFPGRAPVEVAPLSPSPPRTPDHPADSTGGTVPVVTGTALPGAFQEQFQFTRVPVLLLLDKQGVVVARWVGTSPSLADSLAGAIRKRTAVPPSAEK